MPRSPVESLEAFIKRQDSGALSAVLLELAEAHEAVRQRLERLQLADRPDKLAAGFRKTLSAWRRSTRYHSYRESGAYGRMLESWLDQVASELAPKDPPAAVELFETFIESDEAWFEHADDSDGAIGDAVRSACRHWLEAAARCETPAEVWPERLLKLYLADEYGAREKLMRQANRLLDEPALRKLVVGFESRLPATTATGSRDLHLPPEVYKSSAALSLLSEALGDPDVEVRSVLRRNPDPNPAQRESVRACLLGRGPRRGRVDLVGWILGALGKYPAGSSRPGLRAARANRGERGAAQADVRAAS
jgi:hypothetical protein